MKKKEKKNEKRFNENKEGRGSSPFLFSFFFPRRSKSVYFVSDASQSTRVHLLEQVGVSEETQTYVKTQTTNTYRTIRYLIQYTTKW